MPESTPLPFATRLWFAWVCLFRVLFDPRFAARAFALPRGDAAPPERELPPPSRARLPSVPSVVELESPPQVRPSLSAAARAAQQTIPDRPRRGQVALSPPPAPPSDPSSEPQSPAEPALKPSSATAPAAPSTEPALQLLALLQREGRLIDFLEQDIATFPDAEIGAAARVIHEGCRKALRDHATVTPVRTEDEGARVTIAPGFSPAEVKLSGNVGGSPPYHGVLTHRGWRIAQIKLPVPIAGHDPHVLAPAEVEL